MFDPRLPDGAIDAHAMQGATGDGCVRDKRPMTEAEERFIEAAIHAKRIGSLCGTALMLDEMDQLMKERTPKPVEPITPEERAVVEAAKGLLTRAVETFAAKSMDDGSLFIHMRGATEEQWGKFLLAVRRLP